MAVVTWSEPALIDLAEIYRRIGRDSLAIADAFLERIVASSERLEAFPLSGRVVPETADESIREVFVGPYRVMYCVTGDDVDVISVIHGARLIEPPD